MATICLSGLAKQRWAFNEACFTKSFWVLCKSIMITNLGGIRLCLRIFLIRRTQASQLNKEKWIIDESNSRFVFTGGLVSGFYTT